jgi:anti-sigma regulatory factor (Ser/Thr protein kinase)
VDSRLPAAGAEGELAAPVDSGAFRHTALLYADDGEYVATVAGFVRAALGRGEPVLVAVPGDRAQLLREALGSFARQVGFADMTEAGRNPGRIISAMAEFAGSHPGRPVSAVGQPVWPARRPAEALEAARHEALSNLAFAEVAMTALCPYDAASLPGGVLTRAQQTHPLIAHAGGLAPSPAYLGPGNIPAACLAPLPRPPPQAKALTYRGDLQPVRELAGRYAEAAGLPPDRAADLVAAVGELAANTLAHTSGAGTVRLWQTAGDLICEIADQGWIKDPLAGRLRPAADGHGGYGLWVVNQVCDLVETRTGPGGTTTRCHMSLHR